MTVTVSISEFRQNMSRYLLGRHEGDIITLKDDKRGVYIADVIPRKTFDPVAFDRALRESAGVFTEKNHPEWRTKRDVIRWVRKERKAADRTF